MKQLLKKGPAIVFDVDGVLKKGNHPIKGASDTIKSLKSVGIPITLMTNAGDNTVSVKLKQVNSVLQLPEESAISKEEYLMCHSPLANMPELKDQVLLVAGRTNVQPIMRSYGLEKYITVYEYCRLYPFLAPQVGQTASVEETTKIRENVQKRTGLVPYNMPKIETILVLSESDRFEESLQIISDILISNNGKPGNIRKDNEKQFSSLIITNNDLVYQDIFNIPRYGHGSFLLALRAVFKAMYNREIEATVLGKPNKVIFDMARANLKREGYETTEHYIIGDNPEIDMKGGINNGFTPVLVRTGVMKTNISPDEIVVKDVRAAVEYILDKEKISI